MKKLLTKTLTSFTLYSLVVLAASVPAYYYLVDGIWLKELDEHNIILADRTVNELRHLKLNRHEIDESIRLWNKLQPGTDLTRCPSVLPRRDSVYTIMRENLYRTDHEIDRFRGLIRFFILQGEGYQLRVETNVEETEETAVAIAKLTLFFFLILVLGFLLLTRRLSKTLWTPFRNTLDKVKAFNLNSQQEIMFEKSDTVEFEELNDVLNKLIEHNIATYKIQKEFTENASHELQTPLAIIKNKLDLLLQTETLSDKQYDLIEGLNRALGRTARLNKNLLLLAKIENRQFEEQETINLSALIHQCLEDFKEYADQKSVYKVELAAVVMTGNKILIEILITNLLLNAIRHGQINQQIRIELSGRGLLVANPGSEPLLGENIFKRFTKTSAGSPGSGLGLSLIWEICQRHRWTVRYEFTSGQHQFRIEF